MHRTAVSLTLSILIAATLAACGSSPTVGSEVEPGVIFLGQRKVNFKVDRDVIDVGAYEGHFRALRVHVLDSPLEMFDIRVHFGNGAVFSPATRLVFRRGSWTRRIDLPGQHRIIRRIEFVYKSLKPRTGKAHVRVFGIR